MSEKNQSQTEKNVEVEEQGELRVEGTVFVGSIQHRNQDKKTKKGRAKKVANVVTPVGYKIVNIEQEKKALVKKEKIREKIKHLKQNRDQVEDYEEQLDALVAEEEEVMNRSWVFMEKYEAVDYVKRVGAVNATNRVRSQKKKDSEGKVVGKKLNVNLHPKKGERPFTDEDRLYPVFKLDKNGKIKKNPTELDIKEEHCTERLWAAVEASYKNRKPKNPNKTPSRMSEEERNDLIEKALGALDVKPTESPQKWISEE